MKYTIEGFQQKKLVEYGLDVTDALILRWFIDFAATNKMKKRTIELVGEDQQKKVHLFYRIIFDAILEEFPIFGISTKKGLSKRFDKYVESGLLLKHVMHGGINNGTETYFSIMPKINELLYSNEKAESEEITEKNSSSVRNKTTIHENINTIQDNTEENSSSVRIKTTIQESTERNSSSVRKELQFQPNGTRVPLYLNNPSIINPSTNSSSEIQQTSEINSEKEEIKTELAKYFDVNSFSHGFIDSLYHISKENEFIPKDYISWSVKYLKTKVKQSDNFQGYFYKSVTDNYIICLYKSYLLDQSAAADSSKQQSNNYIECPVCSTQHFVYDSCPVCELINPNNEEEIEFRQTIYKLPTEVKQNMDNELDGIFQTGMNNYDELKNIKFKKEEIYIKYIPNLNHEKYQRIFG